MLLLAQPKAQFAFWGGNAHFQLLLSLSPTCTKRFFFSTGWLSVSSPHSLYQSHQFPQSLSPGLLELHHVNTDPVFATGPVRGCYILQGSEPHCSAWCLLQICWGCSWSYCWWHQWSPNINPWETPLINDFHPDTELFITTHWMWSSSQFLIRWTSNSSLSNLEIRIYHGEPCQRPHRLPDGWHKHPFPCPLL